ncbi:MAG: hypothetical protein EON52_13365 [Actinomycetales bacterium]|nr:MAG: hypothetical protein EON52_13365 [Actinomycetales bacterium]
MTTMAAALLGMGYLGAVDEPLWWFGGTVVVFAFGFGLAATPGTSLIIAGLPEDRRTLSAAVNDVTREVGGALGGAIAASVLLASYSSTVGDLGGLPDQAADRAQEGFVQAMEVAQRLPAAERDRLIEAARNAFADGYSVALVIAAAVLVLGAVALLLRAGRGERA